MCAECVVCVCSESVARKLPECDHNAQSVCAVRVWRESYQSVTTVRAESAVSVCSESVARKLPECDHSVHSVVTVECSHQRTYTSQTLLYKLNVPLGCFSKSNRHTVPKIPVLAPQIDQEGNELCQ